MNIITLRTLDIVLDKSSATEALIKITLKEKDYQPKVEEKVKDYSKKANIKGFRPGKVPPGLIKKLYGKSILVEEINDILTKSISEYIKKNDIKLIGEPLPNRDKTASIDWDNQKDFEFEYEVGLVDAFDYNLSQKINAYQIVIDQKTLEKTTEDLTKRYGKYSEPEISVEGDDFNGELSGETPEIKKEVWISGDQIKPKELKKWAGLKKDDEISIDPKKTFRDNETLPAILDIPEKDLREIKGDYKFRIHKISRVEPAELNQEFFDKVFGKDIVKTREEFDEKLKTTLEENYNTEAKNYTLKLIQDKLLETTRIEVPDNFYKKWILATNNEEISAEDLEKHYSEYTEELKWTLIVNRVAEDNEIRAEHQDVVDYAKKLIRNQFAAYGMGDSINENIDSFADNYLKGNEGQNYYNTYNKVRSEKIMEFIMNKIEINYKKVDPEEFARILKTK
ncbi:MAG: trigger factor [Cyclobacteriaceae bacterium]|nr:trigger factor [Cyclobacteriaceae bacterium]